MGYEEPNFFKVSESYRLLHDRDLNKKRRKEIRESHSRKLERGERRKKYFISKTKKKRGNKKMLYEIDSRMALPPPNLSDLGPRDTGRVYAYSSK